MNFIIFMSLYCCIIIVSFVTYVEKFDVTDVLADVTSVRVVMYVAYVLCDLMASECIITFGV